MEIRRILSLAVLRFPCPVHSCQVPLWAVIGTKVAPKSCELKSDSILGRPDLSRWDLGMEGGLWDCISSGAQMETGSDVNFFIYNKC